MTVTDPCADIYGISALRRPVDSTSLTHLTATRGTRKDGAHRVSHRRTTTPGRLIMKPVTGTYALIPSTNYGTFTADGSTETRLVRIEAATTDDGHTALTLTTVDTFPTRAEAFAEVVFCPGCKMVYLRSREGEHFDSKAHNWGDIPASLRGLRNRGQDADPLTLDHFAPITTLTDPEIIADRRAEAMGA